MRLHLELATGHSLIPYNHLPVLVGSLHKWLSKNEWHNELSLYSFSWLKGDAINVSNGLVFNKAAAWFISSHDVEFIKRLIAGIQIDPAINFGLTVNAVMIQEDPTFNEEHTFHLAGPVLIKRRQGDRIKHFIFSDREAGNLLTETLTNKLKKAGLKYEGVQVSFDLNYPSPRTKLVHYNGIGNRASLCPVTIKGSPEQIAFAWNVGVGNSTGIGFGALN